MYLSLLAMCKQIFDDLRALPCYCGFDSWDILMALMIEKLELKAPDISWRGSET